MPTANFSVPGSSSEHSLGKKEQPGLQSDLGFALWRRILLLLKKMGSRSRIIGRRKEGLLPIIKDPDCDFLFRKRGL
jgi:hypothetical protein